MRAARKIILCFTFLLAIPASQAALLPIDKSQDQQPIEVTADSLQYNNKTGIATYTGQVLAKQGTRQLQADIVQLFRNKAGHIEKLKADGHAVFNLENKTEASPLIAKADTIVFDQTTQILTLTGNASVEQAGDIYQAPLIEYNLEKETIYSPASQQGRTNIYLQSTDRY